MKQCVKNCLSALVILGVMVVMGAVFFVYSGVYNIGADDHHTKPVFMMLQVLRNASIHLRSKDLIEPNLNDPQLILKGAGQYSAMCTSCHLTPGMKDSEIRDGMYPQPPNLTYSHLDPRDEFWVIKHGIKMSAMPAWGGSHDDATIWSMVAFIEKLPNMTPQQYKMIVANAPPDDDMDMRDNSSHNRGDEAHDAHKDEHNASD